VEVDEMKRYACVLAIIAVVVLSCTTGGPGPESVGRLVMVSFDGLGSELLWSWLDDGILTQPDGFRGLAENGRAVKSLRMVNPTLTAVNHISLVTGLQPSRTGIVSNSFRFMGSEIDSRVNGFSAPYEGEAIWTIARRQGRRVGVVLWPGSDATRVSRMGDFGVLWPVHPLLESKIIDLDPESATPQMEFPINDGVSALSWVVKIEFPHAGISEFLVAVLDSSPDGIPRFDQLAIRKTTDVSWRYIGVREWFEMQVEAAADQDLRSHPYISWIKALRLDRNSGRVSLYRGAFWRLHAYPSDYSDALVEELGPWPGPPDRNLIADWWIDPDDGIDLDTYLEQAERLDRYIDALAQYTFDHQDFDLMLTYHPIVDEYLHANHIVDSAQWGYSPGKALAAREGLKRVAHSVDQAVSGLWKNLDPENDALVVVSDHGLAPLTDNVRINLVLAKAGLVTLDRSGDRLRIDPSSPMVARTSGGCAHLYLNLKGREPRGVVDSSQAMTFLMRASRVLADLENEGKPVVERIVNRQESIALGLAHPNSGDLIVFLSPGFAASSSLYGKLIEPSRSYAQHGYLNHHHSMDGIFFARGKGIKAQSIKESYATEVAPAVAFLLAIKYP